MAKSNSKSNKAPIPTINQPNSGLMGWINQQTSPNDISTAVESELTPSPATENNQIESAENQPGKTSSADEQQPEQETTSSITLEPVDKEQETKTENNSTVTADSVVGTKKPKNKAGEGKKPETYQETFFKRPVKSTDEAAFEVKPVRISEDSHWLLSVMIEEARRQGYKITLADLVDNLLANHRAEHKTEVDKLINQWKVRKRIG
ncbi:DUF3408 domain-containing protein (plasmid) [Spirosoma sp. SC4-14]|uniref:DUF3408 domain-containing protein n=1 Tax=Spirosoma sp. SC4-14 TaxID=3128900 RepID=UPI0030D4776A